MTQPLAGMMVPTSRARTPLGLVQNCSGRRPSKVRPLALLYNGGPRTVSSIAELANLSDETRIRYTSLMEASETYQESGNFLHGESDNWHR